MLSVESLINKKNQTHTTWVERIINVLHEEGEDSHFAAWTMVSKQFTRSAMLLTRAETIASITSSFSITSAPRRRP